MIIIKVSSNTKCREMDSDCFSDQNLLTTTSNKILLSYYDYY